MTLCAGIIGCGNIAKFHVSGLEKAGVRVKWVCDLSEAAAAPWAARTGAAWTPDYRRVVGDPEVGVVVVATISSAHPELCVAAIDAGKAVICEKTLAENADDALAIVRRAREKGTLFYTSYMKRYIPAVEQAKALLPSLGRIVSTHIRAYQCWGNLWETVPDDGFWVNRKKGGKSVVVQKYGGGILVCGGSHILDLVLFFLGRPARLFATMAQPAALDIDLQAAALLETPNGIVHYEALAHPLNRVGFLRDGWDERIEINGLQGRLEVYSAAWDQVEHKASMLVHTDNRTGTATEYRYPACSPFDRAVGSFCRQIAAGQQGEQSALTGYEVDELIAHIKASAAAGRPVDVNWRL